MENQKKIAVYMANEKKKRLEKIKYSIWKKTGHSVSYSRILRDIFEEQLEDEDHIISKYEGDD